MINRLLEHQTIGSLIKDFKSRSLSPSNYTIWNSNASFNSKHLKEDLPLFSLERTNPKLQQTLINTTIPLTTVMLIFTKTPVSLPNIACHSPSSLSEFFCTGIITFQAISSRNRWTGPSNCDFSACNKNS